MTMVLVDETGNGLKQENAENALNVQRDVVYTLFAGYGCEFELLADAEDTGWAVVDNMAKGSMMASEAGGMGMSMGMGMGMGMKKVWHC